jgi:hypothetical protein
MDRARDQVKVLMMNMDKLNSGDKVLQLQEARDHNRNMARKPHHMDLNMDRDHMAGPRNHTNNVNPMDKNNAPMVTHKVRENMDNHRNMADKVHTDNKNMNQEDMVNQVMVEVSNMEVMDAKVLSTDNSNVVMEIMAELNIVNMKLINIKVDDMEVTNQIGSKNNSDSMDVVSMNKNKIVRGNKNNMVLIPMHMKETRAINQVMDKDLMDHQAMASPVISNLLMVNPPMAQDGINGQNNTNLMGEEATNFVEEKKTTETGLMNNFVVRVNIANPMTMKVVVVSIQDVLHHRDFAV